MSSAIPQRWRWLLLAVVAQMVPLLVGGVAVWWDLDRWPSRAQLLGSGALAPLALVLLIGAVADLAESRRSAATATTVGILAVLLLALLVAAWNALVFRDLALNIEEVDAERVATTSLVFFFLAVGAGFLANTAAQD